MLGLRGRLIYAFLGITLVPLSLLVAVNHWTVSRILTDNARRSLASSARLTADQIDRLIDENLTTVRVEAILPDVIRYIESPSPEHYPAAIQTLLSLARRDSINVLSYGLIQRSGTNVLDTYTPFIGRQEGEKPVFVQAIRTGLPYVDALRRAERRERGLGEISFSAPVRNATGDVIGVLRVTYNATVVAQVIQRQTGTAGEASFAMLLDNNGIRLAHGLSPDWHYQPLLPLTEDQRFQLSQQYPNLGDATPSTDPALQAAIQERETTTLITRLPELGSQKA
ncbi:MAG: cache domain-containing protein, partial [Thermostichales cyanobacterium GMQP_bins_62]